MKLHLLISFLLCWWMYGCITAAKPPVIKTFRHTPLHNQLRYRTPTFNKVTGPQREESPSNIRYFPRPDCPWPYYRIGGLCRNINVPQNLSWEDARANCGAIDGDLTSMYEPELIEVLAYYKGAFQLNGFSTVWVGSKREDANSGFLWLTGDELPDPASKYWIYQDIPGFDCVALVETATRDIKLTNMNCSTNMQFMCECGLCTQ